MVRATIDLYVACAREAASAFPRTALACVALVLVGPALSILAIPLSGLGIVGGFVLGFLQALAVGWYLSLVDIGVNGRRAMRLSDLWEQIGAYLWDVIGVMFVFFVASLLLAPMLSDPVMLALSTVACVAFNPVPEMIYQDRSDSGLVTLGDAARYMQENWIEWIPPHLLALLVLTAFLPISGGGLPGIDDITVFVQTFGPFFGFVNAFGLVFGDTSVVGLVFGLVMLGFVHAFMLFRGRLYAHLRGSSRRSRAWKRKL
jgi:hypothetical protein